MMRRLAIAILPILWSCAGGAHAPPKQADLGYPLRQGTYDYLESVESRTFAGLYLKTLFDVGTLEKFDRQDFRATRMDFGRYEAGVFALHDQAVRAGYLPKPDDNWEAADRYRELRSDAERGGLFVPSDYANELGNPDRISLADQLKTLPPRLARGADFTAIEARLTGVVETLRTSMVARMDQSGLPVGDRAELQPLRVRIAGEGFNPTVARGAAEIVLSPDLLRDMFARSVYRAAALFDEDGLLEDLDCDSCLELEPSLAEFAYSMFELPGAYSPFFPTKVVTDALGAVAPGTLSAEEMKRVAFYQEALTCPVDASQAETQRDTQAGWQLDMRNGREDEDPCENYIDVATTILGSKAQDADIDFPFDGFEGALADIAMLLKKANPDSARDRAFEQYRDEMITFFREAEGEDADRPDIEESLEKYLYYMMRFSMMAQVVEMEMQKAALFLLGHESYHAWFDATPLKQTEFDADRFAIRAYNLAYPELNTDTFLPGYKAPEIGGPVGPNIESTGDDLVASVFGRGPDFIFADTYRGTPYFAGSATHPPFADRLVAIRQQIDVNSGELSLRAEEQFACLFSATTEQQAASCRQTSSPPTP